MSSRFAGFGILAAVLALALAWVAYSARREGSPIIRSGPTGQWIRQDRPWWLAVHPERSMRILYRKRFRAAPGPGTLGISARERFAVFLDRMLVFEEAGGVGDRQQTRTLVLPENLAPGEHELTILVRAIRTEPLLRVEAPARGLSTDGTWECSGDGTAWAPAVLAGSPRVPDITLMFPTTFQALLKVGLWLGLAFGAGAGLNLLRERRAWRTPPAAAVRWGLLALWALLAANNIGRIPANVGMDVTAHLDYVKFLVQHHRIPLATEGWQMFQSPLAYLLSAPLYLLRPGITDGAALHVLRVLPMACGLLQVELAYRAARAVFPGRAGLQIAGTALGGFLPMSIYLSQSFGNEPLAGVLCALAIVWTLTREQGRRLEPRFALGLGALLGLALLAKVQAVLLIPLLAAFCAWRAARAQEALRFLALLGAGILVVSGGYFAWNWTHLGHLFLGGWDRARGIYYWQEPGYVTPSSLAAFGTALVRPIYAGTAGFWNGLYATFWLDGGLSGQAHPGTIPPWNYAFLQASALTALAPCAAMAAGAAAAWRRPPVALGLACIGVFVLAILHLHITAVPSFATLKATYLIGLLPFFGILGAAGLEALPDSVWARSMAAGLLSAWGLSAYAAYFVV